MAAARSVATLIEAVTIAFLIIAFMAVLARTWVRAVMTWNYGLDDVVMTLAMLTYTVYASFNLVLVSWGFGNSHIALEDWAFKAKLASFTLATFSLHTATMVILKISLGIFYLRIVVSQWQRRTVYATVGIAAAYGTYYFFAVLFSCGMPSNFLMNALQGQCSGTPGVRFAINMTAGLVNAGSDLILAVLPVFVIRKSCMPLPAKISACLVLLLGCVGSAVSIVRLTCIRGLSYDLDFFAVGVDITIWSVIEAGLCITAASLVTLRPLSRCCMGTKRQRQSMTADYTMRELSVYEPHYKDEDWTLRKCEASVSSSSQEPDNMDDSTPSTSSPRLKRKAMMLRSKVHIETALSPRQQSRPSSPSHMHWQPLARHSTPKDPAFRYAPAIVGSFNSVDNRVQRLRAASEPWRKQCFAGRARKYSQAPPPVLHVDYGYENLEEAGVRM